MYGKSLCGLLPDLPNTECTHKPCKAGALTVFNGIYKVFSRFSGMTFVLTGEMSGYKRDEAAAIIESYGGKASSSVSKKTTYVLAGENAGSKLKKATDLGINIINEEQFNEMIK